MNLQMAVGLMFALLCFGSVVWEWRAGYSKAGSVSFPKPEYWIVSLVLRVIFGCVGLLNSLLLPIVPSYIRSDIWLVGVALALLAIVIGYSWAHRSKPRA